ncbi:MAG TPA: SUMF1/EgtB/PvdO family nonheme iron enzyme, partial [Polyangiaceae bacterium]|nr:SUMF1/EgtB/PvdO family nonheme iron enzyme [Polyangiaceae bacterium]
MRIAGIVGIAALVAAGCGPSKPEAKGPDLPDTGKAFGGVQCSAVRPQTEPDLMAWDPGSRLNLKVLSNQGVVAVRYEVTGCDVRLEVLSNCIGEGKYEYEPYAANQSKMARNAQELFTELPLGAAALTGKLKNGRALRTDYMLVGARALKAGSAFDRAQLKGDCSKATHVVNRLYVGGFAMMAGETQSLEAAASVFGVGAGGKQSVAGEVVNNEGVAEACTEAQKSAKESAQCAVPLRLGLVPLGAIQTVCPEGSELKGDQCVRKVAAVECPSGSKWDGSKCAASVDASCASGMHFESGRGCVANVVAPAATPVAPAAAAPATVSAGGMVRIPAGVFMMGSNDGDADEKPVHQVRVNAFEMDVTEVTVGAYRACVNAGRCGQP